MSLGQRVKQQRKRRGLSQQELADQLGMKQTLVSRIERGANQNPGADILKRLARTLGCSIDYLVDLYGDDHTPSSSSMAVSA